MNQIVPKQAPLWLTLLAVLASGSALAKTATPFSADPYPSTYRPLPRSDVLITHATVLDGKGQRLEQTDVLMRDGKIIAVGQNLEAGGAHVVDAKGRWMTPGIIDVHSHNGTFSMPLTSIDSTAGDVTERSSPNVADTWIEHAVNAQDPAFSAALRSGVTTLQILSGSAALFGGRSVVVKPVPAADVLAMKFPGAPQGLKMACGENPKSAFAQRNQAPTSRQGNVAVVRAALLEAQDYRASWEAYANGKTKVAPKRDLKMDTLAAVLDGDIAVNFHCYRAGDMTAMLGVAEEFGFHIAAFHHATESYKITEQLKNAGTCSAVWSDWWGFKMELIDAVRENAAIVDAAGACVMMHSDSPVTGQYLHIEAAKAAAAGRRVGIDLPPEHIIQWITSTPAKSLGLGDRIGSIATGYNADIVLWSADPFSIYAKPDLVYIDGALAYDRAHPQRAERSDFDLGRPEMGVTP